MSSFFQVGDLICLRKETIQRWSFDGLVFISADGLRNHKFSLETVFLVAGCKLQSYVFLSDSVLVQVGASWVDSNMRKV